jgi:hypothetical protein
VNDVRPPFISAESHNIDIFCLLVDMGGYKSFNIVDGATVAEKYKNHLIKVSEKNEIYSFPWHSSGLFGHDIPNEWMTPNNFFRLLAYEGLGWKDIHATTEIYPNPILSPSLKFYVKRAIKHKFIRSCPEFMRPLAAELIKKVQLGPHVKT